MRTIFSAPRFSNTFFGSTLGKIFLLVLLSLPTLLRAQVKIMPLGNSITQGDHQHNSYRRALWFKLRNAGYNVDFVGSHSSNFGGAPPTPDFDLNHEGHWGWRADQLLGSIGGWAATYKPDIVLMHVGSNDMLQGQSVESTLSEISQIIDRLRAANPNVKLLLSQLIPTTAAANSQITALNNALPGLASQKSTAQSSITIVNQNAGFNAATDTFDGVHPTSGGEEKMATKWYQALQPLLTATPPAAVTLRTPENPTNTTAGLNYQYYEGTWLQLPDFNNLSVVKAGTTGLPTLAGRNRDDNFAFRYTGFVDVPADGEYTFYTSSDDGSQLFIGSTLVVDNNGAHGVQERAGKIGLLKGKHALTLTFFENTGDQLLTASYAGPGLAKTQIPAAALFRADTGAGTGTTASTFYRAINLNGPALTLDGNAWEGRTAANFSYAGNTHENQGVALVPATDADRTRMIRSFVWSGAPSVTLSAVPAGDYDVYVYVWEDNNSETFSIKLDNKLVMSNHQSGSAGSWQKLGPWRTTVSTGTLTLSTQGGAANLSGLEVWRAATTLTKQATTSSLAQEEKLVLYPNPSSSQVYLGAEDWSQVIVRDSYGRVRLTQKQANANTPLDTSALPNGIYMVEARSTTGNTLRNNLVVAH